MAEDQKITLRDATIADLDLLQLWDEQPHVIASDPDDDWDWEYELPRSVAWREQLMAELNGQPVGFIQIIDPAEEESNYWGDVSKNLRAIDIWIGMEENLNKGYGTKMMNMALERCFKHNEVTAVIIDPLTANAAAIRFYKRLGFQFVETRSFGKSDCSIYNISRESWVMAHQ